MEKEILKERLENMPRGLDTVGLMSHETNFENIENILKDGILSIAEQYKRYGKCKEKYEPLIQKNVGHNYISVHDPYCGYQTRAWHEGNEEVFLEKLKRIMKEEYHKGNKILYKRSFGDWIYFNEKDMYSPEHLQDSISLSEQIHQALKETMIKKEDIPLSPLVYSKTDTGLYKTYPKNPIDAFAGDNVFLINPKIERFPIGNWPFESVIKDKINPEDLTGLIFLKTNEGFNVRQFDEIKKLSKNYGIPLFSREYDYYMPKDSNSFTRIYP
ncbi:MAG: hypothetical protein ABIE36_01335 [Candidatus Diapherotrites archaeon]